MFKVTIIVSNIFKMFRLVLVNMYHTQTYTHTHIIISIIVKQNTIHVHMHTAYMKQEHFSICPLGQTSDTTVTKHMCDTSHLTVAIANYN